MAGLLTGIMLRRHRPVLFEAQKELPDNHGALLRFRSDAVARETGIPFKKVTVRKGIEFEGFRGPIALSNMYSLKVTGEVHDRSIHNLDPVERWIAPDNFISAMQEQVGICLGHELKNVSDFGSDIVISTIPMPTLMKIVGWQEIPEFKFKSITSLRVRIEDPVINIYQTLYFPDLQDPIYRATFSGNYLIVEYVEDFGEQAPLLMIKRALEVFGIFNYKGPLNVSKKFQKYGKILPIDEDIRRSFILGMTQKYGIYSVGRFATWRQILLDDVVEDIKIVDRFISDKSQYARHLWTN
jgi:hypothetical protein